MRLRRHIQPGGRLIEQQRLRLTCQRHRNRHALLLAPRQLVRITAYNGLRIGQTHLPQQFDDFWQLRGSGKLRCSFNASINCVPMRDVGVSDCPEFCGINARCPPRIRSSCWRVWPNISSPRNVTEPSISCKPRFKYPMAARASVLLPDPLSPTRPTLSPRRTTNLCCATQASSDPTGR